MHSVCIAAYSWRHRIAYVHEVERRRQRDCPSLHYARLISLWKLLSIYLCCAARRGLEVLPRTRVNCLIRLPADLVSGCRSMIVQKTELPMFLSVNSGLGEYI